MGHQPAIGVAGPPPSPESIMLGYLRRAFAEDRIDADELEEQIDRVLHGEKINHPKVVKDIPVFFAFATETMQR